jgi:3-hydroxyisobutyrate dehydrogenase
MAEKVQKVAVLGTGIMGVAIARNLARAGLEVRAWNRTSEKAEPLAGDGVEVASSAGDAAGGADAVITMLADAEAVLGVMGDDVVAAEPSDAIWLQMSTIGLDATQRAASLAERAGLEFVDAPVLGTKKPAEEGKLIVLASGGDEALDACEPIFDAVAARVVRLGEAGAGMRMKLVLNNWLLSLTAGLAETLAVADRLGVDGRKFLEVIEGGPMDADYAQLKGGMMIERDYETSFPLEWATKDARLVLEAVDGDELLVTEAIRGRFEAAIEMGLGEKDMSAVYEAASARDDARPAAAA